jgi:FlaA1/EpsC-like NDP-sugar epimerase
MTVDVAEQAMVIDSYVRDFTADFSFRRSSRLPAGDNSSAGRCVLITGATGSFGADLVAHCAALRLTSPG